MRDPLPTPSHSVPPLRRIRRTRLVLDHDGDRRPLLAFTASSGKTGGLILDLSGRAPALTWKYGSFEGPEGGGSSTLTLREATKVVVPDDQNPPKLHYHRTGYVSIDQTGNLPKRSIDAEPLVELHHAHCFTALFRRPFRWNTDDPRSSDSVFRVHGEPPRSLKVVGYVGQLADLHDAHQQPTENPWQMTVELESGAVAPVVAAVLSAHGIDSYVWLELHVNPDEYDDRSDAPHALLFAFSNARALDLTRPSEALAILGESAAANTAANERGRTTRTGPHGEKTKGAVWPPPA
jgi:hypothetical protein